MRSGKPRFVTGTPGCSGPRSKDPSPQLSSECVICVVGSCVFAIFRRLALHLQPRTEPTPVETVAPPFRAGLLYPVFPLELSLLVSLPDVITLVKELFSLGDAKLDFHDATFKIELQRNEGQALL